MPGRFFDTNVLISLASGDPAKAAKAETLLAEGGTISVRVLNEIANMAHRKMRLSWDETHAFLTSIRSGRRIDRFAPGGSPFASRRRSGCR